MTVDQPNSGSEGQASDPESVTPKDNRAKAGDIKSLEGLISFAYEQHGKRFSVSATALKSLSQRRSELSDGEPDRDPCLGLIVQVSASDPLLLVPPRLLVAIEDGGASVPLRRRVAALITAVLRRHPAFQADQFQLALTAEPPNPDDLFGSLATTVIRMSPENLGFESKRLKSVERDKLLTNATTTLALVLAIRDGWPLDRFIECLDTHLWRRARTPGSREPRALLADSKTPDALAVVADVFAARARKAETQAKEYDEYSRQASRRAFEAEAALEDGNRHLLEREREIEQLLGRIRELEAAVSSEQRNRVVDRSHHVGDFEALRTRVVRMLERQTDLLSDGLHALRHGSTAVADEYLERAVEALSKERDQLKSQGAGKQ